MTTRINRRRFLKASTTIVGAGYFHTATALSAARAADGPSGKVRFAGIGVGGKGSSDMDGAAQLGPVVAICDIDDNTLGRKANAKHDKTGEQYFLSAKRYADYRKMLDEMHKDIDAVTVSTPDHTHAPAAIMAMKLKKHVYVQKPLCHTVFEARRMREIAKEYGVQSQMGNQGSASNSLRRFVEIVQSGALGQVTEAHVWTNRPAQYWKQAPDIVARPPEKPVPKNIHWDEFIGSAPMRPYGELEQGGRRGGSPYLPSGWRGWWDFGTGAMGDMACHTANMAFRALKLGAPTSVVADATDVNSETYPSSARVTYQFPARGDMGPVKYVWYEGKRDGKKLLPPADIVAKALALDPSTRRAGRLVDSGSILIGTKGMLYSPNDNGTEAYFGPVEEFRNLQKTEPEKLPKNGKGDDGMKIEWVEAIKGGPAAYSNFDFAGPMVEAILLGNIAIRMNGTLLNWDSPNLKFINSPEATKFVTKEYRKGFSI
ncbi:MAG: Gfo/Idh/MocA family oxidoreductase [Gemmataceae bacterium]